MTVRLQDEVFDSGVLLTEFCRDRRQTGAVVSFTGLVRADDGVQALELVAYPGFTDIEIAKMVEAACARFAVQDVLIVHRTGLMAPGEPVVFVAAAAAHRRAAFLAADHLMDYLKSRAPFWKKSHDAEGVRWIEPTGADYNDASRWDAPDGQHPDLFKEPT
jgi:molybdopterin synthase catalytic subunit